MTQPHNYSLIQGQGHWINARCAQRKGRLNYLCLLPNLILILALFTPTVAFSLLTTPESVENALQRAPIVAEIEVLSLSAKRSSTSLPITFQARAKVRRLIRSPARGPHVGETIIISGPGGEVGDTGLFFSGIPRPYRGELYRAFLREQEDGSFVVQGFEHGLVFLGTSRQFTRNRTDGSNGEGQGAFLFWDDTFFPIPFFVSADSFKGVPQYLPAIERSFHAWRDVAGTRFDFVASGCSTTLTNDNDGINSIILVTDRWPFDPTIIAITRNFYVAGDVPKSGMILDSDILLNGVDHQFTISDEPGKHDVQNILTHEIGHFLGLGHETSPINLDATMYAIASPNEIKKRHLQPTDIDGIRAAYPGGGQKLPQSPLSASCQLGAASCGAVHGNTPIPRWGIVVTLCGLAALLALGRGLSRLGAR